MGWKDCPDFLKDRPSKTTSCASNDALQGHPDWTRSPNRVMNSGPVCKCDAPLLAANARITRTSSPPPGSPSTHALASSVVVCRPTPDKANMKMLWTLGVIAYCATAQRPEHPAPAQLCLATWCGGLNLKGCGNTNATRTTLQSARTWTAVLQPPCSPQT